METRHDDQRPVSALPAAIWNMAEDIMSFVPLVGIQVRWGIILTKWKSPTFCRHQSFPGNWNGVNSIQNRAEPKKFKILQGHLQKQRQQKEQKSWPSSGYPVMNLDEKKSIKVSTPDPKRNCTMPYPDSWQFRVSLMVTKYCSKTIGLCRFKQFSTNLV